MSDLSADNQVCQNHCYLKTFNIKEDFLEQGDSTWFSHIVHGTVDRDILDVKLKQRHCHWISVDGEPLYYVAVIGKRKTSFKQWSPTGKPVVP